MGQCIWAATKLGRALDMVDGDDVDEVGTVCKSAIMPTCYVLHIIVSGPNEFC